RHLQLDQGNLAAGHLRPRLCDEDGHASHARAWPYRQEIERDGPGMARVIGLRATLCCAALLAAAPSTEAGHEVPYYPSFYPQEIRIEPLDPASAGKEFLNKTAPLNVYIGASPRFDGQAPGFLK